MDERLARLESAVALLTADLAEMRERLALLETRTVAAPADEPRPPAILAPLPELQPGAVQGWLALTGRTLLVLGGAYLLRALTAANMIPVTAGVLAGLVYGAPWLLLASRAGAKGERLDAFCHGLATALIGYPLVWEATVRFHVLTPAESAVVLGGLTAAALVLSVTRHLHSLAAIVTIGAIASALGLGVATGTWLSYTLLAIAVGLATTWVGYMREWVLLRWPAALVVNLMIVVLTGHPEGSPWLVVLVQVIALVGYLGSFAIRSLVQSNPVVPFEVAQSVGVLLFALGSLLSLVGTQHAAVLVIAISCLLIGAATYAAAFTRVERRAPAHNVFFYSLIATALVILGLSLALAPLAAVNCAILGVVSASFATRHRPTVIALQAGVYLIAAASTSGLFTIATAALVSPVSGWLPLGVSAVVALVAMAVVLAIATGEATSSAWPIYARVPRLIVASAFTWSLLGVAVLLIARALPDAAVADAAWLATLRTALLVAATVIAARAAGTDRGTEAGWLMYPLLLLTGVKLMLSDFPQGRPATLFLALALYGTALIAAPRIARQPRTRRAASAGAAEPAVADRHALV